MARPLTTDTLGGRLRLARTMRGGMTQQQLATLAGMEQPDISKIERGEIQQTTGIARLADALQVPARWLELNEGAEPNWTVLQHSSAGVNFRPVDQSMIQHEYIVPLPMTWEALMEAKELVQLFRVAMPDDALAPRVPRGTELVFDSSKAPEVGKGVLVQDRHGKLYIRRYGEGIDGAWLAQSVNDAYASLDSRRDGLVLLAAMVGRLDGTI